MYAFEQHTYNAFVVHVVEYHFRYASLYSQSSHVELEWTYEYETRYKKIRFISIEFIVTE